MVDVPNMVTFLIKHLYLSDMRLNVSPKTNSNTTLAQNLLDYVTKVL